MCQNTWFAMLSVCSTEGEWAAGGGRGVGGSGIEDRDVYDSDKVKELSGLGETPI